MTPHYSQFIDRIKEIYALKSAEALLGWDQETFMPAGGGAPRAEAMAALSKIIQEKYCAPELGDLIDQCETEAGLSEEAAANVREVRRDREKLLKIPVSLTEELSKTTSLSQQTWGEVRKGGDPKKFLPWLTKVVELKQREAECLGYAEEPYDALLDTYEPGATAAETAALLSGLRDRLVPLLQKITHSGHQPNLSPLSQVFSVDLQKKFNLMVLQDMGFGLRRGRLDESAHPFTQGVWPTDVRLTTRYSEKDLAGALFGTVHEGGHGLYEQGFLSEHYGTPMAEAVSLGVHESQSRLWENQIARSMAFWKRYYPQLKKLFPHQLGNFALPEFYAAINTVRPSFIRVEADEVTYNLHIVLRFELERDLFSRRLGIGDLEEAWNQKMKKLFGMTPPSPGDGYLQDVHWSLGLFGYFPTYSLGNLYAAQLFQKMAADLEPLDEKIEEGAFGEMVDWLGHHVHRWGRQYAPADLMQMATGNAPDPSYFIDYLESKYAGLYGF